MIDLINSEYPKHIVTVEDPIEFFHRHKRSIINQREVGEDTQNFNNALRSVLRQAPDVILVGEMRDYETIGAAVTAAETGHLVMATLHTNTASEAIDRIIDVFPEAQQEQVRVQLANNLQAILTQQLVPRMNGEGRVLAYEFLLATPAIRNQIREGKTHQIPGSIQTSGQLGMITMDACLAELHLRKVISFETGLARAVDQKEFERLVSTGGIAAQNGGTTPPPRVGGDYWLSEAGPSENFARVAGRAAGAGARGAGGNERLAVRQAFAGSVGDGVSIPVAARRTYELLDHRAAPGLSRVECVAGQFHDGEPDFRGA